MGNNRNLFHVLRKSRPTFIFHRLVKINFSNSQKTFIKMKAALTTFAIVVVAVIVAGIVKEKVLKIN